MTVADGVADGLPNANEPNADVDAVDGLEPNPENRLLDVSLGCSDAGAGALDALAPKPEPNRLVDVSFGLSSAGVSIFGVSANFGASCSAAFTTFSVLSATLPLTGVSLILFKFPNE